MKRAFVKAVLMLLALALPAAACGQTARQTVTENGRMRETLVTFAEDAPQAIRDLMNGHGLGDARCVCGAALEQEAMAGEHGYRRPAVDEQRAAGGGAGRRVCAGGPAL